MDRRSALLLMALVATLVALVGTSVFLSAGGERSRGVATPAPDVPGTTFAGFIGDEITAGPDDTDRSSRWTSVVAAEKSLSQFNVAQQTTSYLTGGGSVSRQVAELPPRDYRFIFVSFTIDAAQVRDKLSPSAADVALRNVRQRYPGAKVIAISPVAVNAKSLKVAETAGAILGSSVKRVGGQYIEVGQPIVRGSSSPTVRPTDQSVQASMTTAVLATLG